MKPGPPELDGRRAPGHFAAPFRIEQRLIAARLRSLGNERGVEAGRQEEQVVGDPIALGVLVLRRIGLGRIGQPLQHVAFLLERHDRRGAVEHVGLRLARPALVDDLDRELGGVGAGRAHLDAVFLLEGGAHRAHELGDDLGRVPDHLAFLLRGLDQGGVGGLADPATTLTPAATIERSTRERASHGVLPISAAGHRLMVGTSRADAAAELTRPRPSAIRNAREAPGESPSPSWRSPVNCAERPASPGRPRACVPRAAGGRHRGSWSASIPGSAGGRPRHKPAE